MCSAGHRMNDLVTGDHQDFCEISNIIKCLMWIHMWSVSHACQTGRHCVSEVQIRTVCPHTVQKSLTSVHKPGPKVSAHMSVQGICKKHHLTFHHESLGRLKNPDNTESDKNLPRQDFQAERKRAHAGKQKASNKKGNVLGMAALLYHSQLLMHAIAVGNCFNKIFRSSPAEACPPTGYLSQMSVLRSCKEP